MIHKIKTTFIGDRAFYTSVFTVAIPLMLQSLITASVALVDNLMVGQLGDAVIGAVASVNRFYMIANFGINGIVTAACIFLAQYYGARNPGKMKESFRFALISAVSLMLPFFLVAMFAPNIVLQFFTKDAELIRIGSEYLRIVGLSFLPAAISIALYGSIRSIGETKLPLYISVSTVFINAFLNYLLIFGMFGFPKLGSNGAAIATLTARLIELGILLLVMVYNHFEFSTKIKDIFRIDPVLSKNILVKALPLALNEVLWAAGMASLLKIYGTRGVEVMSGYSVASTTADLFFALFNGMSIATTVLISQKLGANQLKEARVNGYKLIGTSFMLAAVLGCMLFLTSFIVPNLFTISDGAKLFARNILVIMSFFFWIYMTTAQCYFVLRAGGDMKSTLIMDATYMWLVNIPILAMLAYGTDISIYFIYIAGQLTDIVKLCLAFFLVRRERWVHNMTEHLH